MSDIYHIVPLNDLLPHRDDDCPCTPRLTADGNSMIHNSWDGREQSESGGTMGQTPRIEIFKDGDQWCALAGADIQQGYAGFGDSPHEALRRLLSGWRDETR